MKSAFWSMLEGKIINRQESLFLSGKWSNFIGFGHFLKENSLFFGHLGGEKKNGNVYFFSSSGTIFPCRRTLSTKQYTADALRRVQYLFKGNIFHVCNAQLFSFFLELGLI